MWRDIRPRVAGSALKPDIMLEVCAATTRLLKPPWATFAWFTAAGGAAFPTPDVTVDGARPGRSPEEHGDV